MKNVIALGTENKTSFSVITEEGLYTSAPAGDLNDISNFNRYEEDARKHLAGNSVEADLIACDLHPDYRSTLIAESLLKDKIAPGLVRVQHHFAHIVSCMFDNDVDEEVIGVSFDGTGYGEDGKSWGSEFMLCSRKEFTRKYHLRYVPQPGGDIAAREGWRMALAYILGAYGESFDHVTTPLLGRIGEKKVALVRQMIERDINSPVTSSMGRLFDAVSSMIGVCDGSTFEAEAAIKLEKETVPGVNASYGYEISGEEIIVDSMVREVLYDLERGEDKGVISSRFHNTVGEIVLEVCSRLREETGISKVMVSGGCFQNGYLLGYLEGRFSGSDMRLYKHEKYPPTDLGISIGQAVAASSEI